MNITELLIEDENKESKLYLDSEGYWTIGIGRNLSAKGLSEDEIMYLFNNDLKEAETELNKYFDIIADLDRVRYMALTNMMFNLGAAKFALFVKMLAALRAKDYELAATEMLDSKWAKQVGSRATRLAEMMRKGNDYEQ